MKKKALTASILLIAAAAVLCFVLLRPGAQTTGTKIFLDGREYSGLSQTPENRDDLRVILTLDGKEIADLPFGEAHKVRILQENGEIPVRNMSGAATDRLQG